jgi:alpha-ribazole phosphatase
VSRTTGKQGAAGSPLGVRLFAVRHAPTLCQGLCVGDADLASAMSAEEAASRMQALVAGHAFASVWSSPRSRCLGPARVLAGQLGLPLQVDERLREISLGIWQGQSWDAIEAGDSARFREWLSHWIDTAPPGGESTTDLVLRLGSWWREFCCGCHLLVAHAGVIRGLRVLLHGDSWPEAMRAPVPHLHGEWFSSAVARRPEDPGLSQ